MDRAPSPSSGRVLIIAGSDSGGGAGIQGDIKTVTALGGYAATAVTALTAQNTQGVFGIHDALDDQRAAPAPLDPFHVGPGQRRVELLGRP